MQFTITHWGCTPSGDSIYLFRLTNATGASIELTNLGATWVSANMPNRYDVFENILLGYDKVEGYLKDTYYMGATVGRFANRIHQASFSIEGTTYLLEKNDGENTNHGGLSGFHKKIWSMETNRFRHPFPSPLSGHGRRISGKCTGGSGISIHGNQRTDNQLSRNHRPPYLSESHQSCLLQPVRRQTKNNGA